MWCVSLLLIPRGRALRRDENFGQRQSEAQWAWPMLMRSLPFSLPLSLFLFLFSCPWWVARDARGLPAGLRAVTGDTDTVQQHLVFNGGVFGQTRAAIRRLAGVSTRFAFLLCMRFMHRTLYIMKFANLSSRHYTGKARAWRCSRSLSRAEMAVEG